MSSINIGALMECVTGLLESRLVVSPLVHAKLVELLTCMLRSSARGAGGTAAQALSLAVLGALLSTLRTDSQPSLNGACCSLDSFVATLLRQCEVSELCPLPTSGQRHTSVLPTPRQNPVLASLLDAFALSLTLAVRQARELRNSICCRH